MNSACSDSWSLLSEYSTAKRGLLTPQEQQEFDYLLPKPAAIPFRPWVEKYLGHYLTCAPSPFHDDLAASLSTLHDRRGSREVWLSPRGNAKTTWSTFAYPLYCAVNKLETYTILISDTATQAAKYLQDIKRELEDNEELRRDYPEATGRGRVWRDNSIELRNGTCLESLGSGNKIRGRKYRGERPTLIIPDDIQNKDHMVSPLRRERSLEWFRKDVMNAGQPRTNFLVLGTAHHREDVLASLRSGWARRVYRSIITWPDKMELWQEWERVLQNYEVPDYEAKARAFYEAHKEEMERGHKVLWPQRFPLYDLMLKRATEGAAAFASEQQNDPQNPEACEWPASYFDGDELWFLEWPAPEEIVLKAMALDPSKGKDAKSGDYSAYIQVALGRNGVVYVDANLERRPVDKIVADGLDLYKRFLPAAFAVEINQFQELLAGEFLRQNTESLHLPLFGINNTINKEVRIRALTTWFAQRRMRFKMSPGSRMLMDQLKDFPQGEHDDGPDALEQAVRMLDYLYTGQATGITPQAMGSR